jgi:hypothetical protein
MKYYLRFRAFTVLFLRLLPPENKLVFMLRRPLFLFRLYVNLRDALLSGLTVLGHADA